MNKMFVRGKGGNENNNNNNNKSNLFALKYTGQ